MEDKTLDLRGLKCPLPVLKTRKALSKLVSGDQLIVLTTDPMSTLDLPHMCNEDGHTVLSSNTSSNGTSFLIRKG
ncbi:MAG: sulfurtransferase TusA family protein [Rhodobacteraceae bacterium]|nr:sulfurtransferase TusA family protein [Paracoccaceae bacterium]